MRDLDSVLIVDRSKVMQHALQTVLRPHALDRHTATSCGEAIKHLELDSRISLILCDHRLPDGNGFDMLEYTAAHTPSVHVVLMATHYNCDEHERATAAGALAYLAKPVSLGRLARAWNGRGHEAPEERSWRAQFRRSVRLVDSTSGDTKLLSWIVDDMSVSGAFIKTDGPFPVGEVLELEIDSDVAPIRVRAVVVRVQEPSWLYPGGIGVRFEELDEQLRDSLHATIHEPDKTSTEETGATP
jgi:CheY-like chemotaxis protein